MIFKIIFKSYFFANLTRTRHDEKKIIHTKSCMKPKYTNLGLISEEVMTEDLKTEDNLQFFG